MNCRRPSRPLQLCECCLKTVMVRHKIIYSSFYDFGEKAQSELDRLRKLNVIDDVDENMEEEIAHVIGA